MTSVMSVAAFYTDRGCYGIEMTHVMEVSRLNTVTPIPWGPDLLLGATNVRGEVYPIIDIVGLIDERPSVFEGDGVVVKVVTQRLSTLLYLGELCEVLDVGCDSLCDEKQVGAWLRFVERQVMYENRTIGVVNVAAVLEAALLAVNESVDWFRRMTFGDDERQK